MDLKLPALIICCTTLFSLSISLPQDDQGTDELEKMRATIYAAFADQPVPTLEVVPVDGHESYYRLGDQRVYPGRTFTDLSPPAKREESELPPTHLYVCEEPMLKGRCEKLASKRGLCYTLKNGWNNEISSLCPQVMAICTVYDDDHCKDPILKDIQYPGIPDLGIPLPPNGVRYINNSIGSYSCV